MDAKNVMKIADLPMNVNTKLTPSIQDKLVKIINDEFYAQSTMYNSEIKLGEDKVLDNYRKLFKMDALLKERTAVENRIAELHAERESELQELERVYEKQQAQVKKRFDKREATLDKAVAAVDKKFSDTPFDTENRLKVDYKSEKGKEAYKQVRAELDAVGLRHPQNLKNKIIARLLIATTTGEAMVILREVLGNGVLPAINKGDFLALADKSEKPKS
jgi:hypothetical protein